MSVVDLKSKFICTPYFVWWLSALPKRGSALTFKPMALGRDRHEDAGIFLTCLSLEVKMWSSGFLPTSQVLTCRSQSRDTTFSIPCAAETLLPTQPQSLGPAGHLPKLGARKMLRS